jgi:hypothetical protein
MSAAPIVPPMMARMILRILSSSLNFGLPTLVREGSVGVPHFAGLLLEIFCDFGKLFSLRHCSP